MRTIHHFSDHWLYFPADVKNNIPDSQFQPVTLPHSNIQLPHHNFDNAEYQFISTYRKHFTLPEPRAGRRVYLDFDGAMIACEVFLNNHFLGKHKGGFTPFSFDLTDYLIEDGDNLLVVRLDSTERKDIPPYGFVVDYLTFGGIYRDVWLRLVEPCHIRNVFARTSDVLTDDPLVDVDTTIENQDDQPHSLIIRAALLNQQGEPLVWSEEELTVRAGETLQECDLTIPAAGGDDNWIGWSRPKTPIERWTLDNPTLYCLKVTLFEAEAVLDECTVRFGFREAEFRQDGGFYLNGERLKLVGLNRHQTYPYIGAAAPARLQRRDAEILKNDLAVNIVRTSHYPQSPYFLDRCDEIGLLVFEEIPGWQFIGDNDWKALSMRDLQVMIERDRNHPSIILWGVRINESEDDETFYTATNALAHQLDPTRQTGGVRYIHNSQFLEDVFTFNDFSNTVVEPQHTPYLITEFNGHMFPTKSWDHEERLVEHALRHARIQDKQLGMDQVAGAIGWCAFDYNTHQEFGSGDHICYHGVMDIFRLPKYAAYFYQSQISPNKHLVLQAATVWSMGDRSGGGLNPLVVFSNCDAIELYIGSESAGRFEPDREHFPNLPHPPYQIPMVQGHLTWGKQIADLRLVGFLNGEAVVEQLIAADGLPQALYLEADSAELIADGADMTRVVLKIVDRYGNRLPYTNQVVEFEVDGPADLIGENPFALMGGQAALYLRARHEPGIVTVQATTSRLPTVRIYITLKAG